MAQFTVTADWRGIGSGEPVPDGKVVVHSNLRGVAAQGEVGYVPDVVTAKVVDGILRSLDDSPGVLLTANTPDLNIDGDLQYTFSFAPHTVPGSGGTKTYTLRIPDVTVTAPTVGGGTVALPLQAPVVAATPVGGITKGDPGPVGVDGYEITPEGLVQFLRNDESGEPTIAVGDPVPARPVTAESITNLAADREALLTGAVDSARKAIGASPVDAVVYASNEGVLASADTNSSVAFAAMVTAVATNSVIQLQAGAYNVSTLRNLVCNKNITIRGVPGRTRLVGDSSITVSNYAADIMFRVDGGSIRFENIAFEDTGTPVGIKGLMELGDIEFTNCTFNGCTGVAVEVYDPAGVATRLGQGKVSSWRNFRMTNCDVRDCEMGVVLRTDGGYESVILADTTFNNVGWAGIWVGTEYGLSVDRTLFQRLQSCFTVHDCVFRDMRLSQYAAGLYYVTNQVNAVVGLGQVMTIHDNLIETITNTAVWDDCEAIYTKGRYFDIHDNILVDAGGSEAAIMVKGVAYDQSTTLAPSMNGLSLPQATINVASTEGFLHPTSQTAIMVMTSNGPQVVQFTGRTATSFTGCTGGTGTMSTGGLVRGEISPFAMTGVSQPGKIHHNIVVFTRMDVAQNGITSTMPGIEISDNLIDGATNRGVTVAVWADNCVVRDNRIINHHGTVAILAAANGVVVDGNSIEQIDGSYEAAATSLRAIFVEAGFSNVAGVIIRNNVLYNRLAADGTRSAASQKLRFLNIQGVGSYTVSDVRVTGNKARNISIGINAVVDGPISDLLALDNDWYNEDGSAVTHNVTHASPRMVRQAGTLRGSSGVASALSVTPVVAQSGTAGYNGLLVDVTEASVGSGNKNLMEARLGGSIYWSVDNAGRMRLPMGAIELGNASDTTVARASAGRISVEGNVVGHVLSNSAALNFGSVAAASSADLTITVTGAAVGDSVALGVPVEAISAGLVYTAWVSATNTVTVRAHNYSAAPIDPSSGTFKATIIR